MANNSPWIRTRTMPDIHLMWCPACRNARVVSFPCSVATVHNVEAEFARDHETCERRMNS